jgi:hypothetical protein
MGDQKVPHQRVVFKGFFEPTGKNSSLDKIDS